MLRDDFVFSGFYYFQKEKKRKCSLPPGIEWDRKEGREGLFRHGINYDIISPKHANKPKERERELSRKEKNPKSLQILPSTAALCFVCCVVVE